MHQTGSKPTHCRQSENTETAHHLWACFHLHNKMPSALQLTQAQHVPAAWLCMPHTITAANCHSQPPLPPSLPVTSKHRTDVLYVYRLQQTLLLRCRGGSTSLAHLQYRPDLESDVSVQSGTGCAAAPLMALYCRAAHICQDSSV